MLYTADSVNGDNRKIESACHLLIRFGNLNVHELDTVLEVEALKDAARGLEIFNSAGKNLIQVAVGVEQAIST